MMKRMLLAAAGLATLASVAAFTAPAAEARVYVYGGVPYYGYAMAPHWRYYDGRGWYDPYRYGYVQTAKMTCSQARRAVKASGFYNVTTIDCAGKIYNFSAWKNGRQRYVSVNSWTGAVWRN